MGWASDTDTGNSWRALAGTFRAHRTRLYFGWKQERLGTDTEAGYHSQTAGSEVPHEASVPGCRASMDRASLVTFQKPPSTLQ